MVGSKPISAVYSTAVVSDKIRIGYEWFWLFHDKDYSYPDEWYIACFGSKLPW